MATGSQALKSRQVPPEVVLIKPSKSMRECADETGLTIGAYLIQLHLADRAERRKRTFCGKQELATLPTREEVAPIVAPKGRRILTPEQVQAVLHHRFGSYNERMTVAELSQRYRVGRSTIRRILDAYEAHEHVDFVSPGPREVNRAYNGPLG